MPVDSTHTDYAAHLAQWTRVRDAYGGSDDVKAKGELYLPRLSGQDNDRYGAYKKAAMWYNATKRTIRSVKGMIMRKPPLIVVPPIVEALRKDITLTNMRLLDFIEWMVIEVLVPGRAGVAVNWSDAERRPVLTGYPADRITNWRYRKVGDEWKLSELRLLEYEMVPDPKDQWEEISVPQYRVMGLDDLGLLTIDVYRKEKKKDSKEEWVAIEEEHRKPSRRGARLDFIPFVFFNPTGCQPDVEEPPFLDLADVNFDHYRLDAEHKYGLTKGAMGTLVLTGWELPGTSSTSDDGEGSALNEKIAIGTEYALHTSNPEAEAKLLEFTGAGLNPIKEEKEKDEDRMAALGARVLEMPKAGVEAAAAMELRHAGETSTIHDIVSAVEQAAVKALGIFSWWAGAGDSISFPEDQLSIQINRDYSVKHVDHNLLREVMKGVQSGDVDEKTWFHFLQESELSMPDDTFEDFQARKAEMGPRELDGDLSVIRRQREVQGVT